MNATTDLSIVSLITDASLVVQIIMALLLLVSFMSWTSIFSKAFSLGRARRATNDFEEEFWSGNDVTALYQRITTQQAPKETLERIFEAGFREFLKYRKLPGSDPSVVMESARRAMRATFQRDLDRLESSLNFLATTGSVSPYVGLFGTVWGIMNAFRGLANVGQATLAHVAPGIAEALVATAMGLFAAIPAVIAYNRFTYDVDRMANRFETFIEEFSNILQRQLPATTATH